MMTQLWKIQLFGALSAEQGERRVTRFRTDAAVLASMSPVTFAGQTLR